MIIVLLTTSCLSNDKKLDSIDYKNTLCIKDNINHKHYKNYRSNIYNSNGPITCGIDMSLDRYNFIDDTYYANDTCYVKYKSIVKRPDNLFHVSLRKRENGKIKVDGFINIDWLF